MTGTGTQKPIGISFPKGTMVEESTSSVPVPSMPHEQNLCRTLLCASVSGIPVCLSIHACLSHPSQSRSTASYRHGCSGHLIADLMCLDVMGQQRMQSYGTSWPKISLHLLRCS